MYWLTTAGQALPQEAADSELNLPLHECHRPRPPLGAPALRLRPAAKPPARPQAEADPKPKRKRGEPAAKKGPAQLAATACRGLVLPTGRAGYLTCCHPP